MKNSLKTALSALLALQLTACEDVLVVIPLDDDVSSKSLVNGYYLSGFETRNASGYIIRDVDGYVNETYNELYYNHWVDNRSAEHKAVPPFYIESIKYNEEGQFLKRDFDGRTISTFETFSYDEFQRLGSNVFIEENNIETEYFNYNAASQLTSRVRTGDGDGNIYQHNYEYDSNGNMLLMTSGNPSIPPPYDTTYFSYDADGRLQSSQKDIGTDGTIDSTIAYSFDTNGNLVEKIEYSITGAVFQTTNYEYRATTEPLVNYTLWELAYFRQ